MCNRCNRARVTCAVAVRKRGMSVASATRTPGASRHSETMRQSVRPWLLLLLCLARALHAGAAHRCGDDVDGHPAPCGCGDLLVSSRMLGPADPVTRNRCSTDGLRVLAPGPVTLAFAGQTIRG